MGKNLKKHQQSPSIIKKTGVGPESDMPLSICFIYAHDKIFEDNNHNKGASQILKKLITLTKITWNHAREGGRHGRGYEKIPVPFLKIKKKVFEENNIEKAIVFRLIGKKPIIGFRKQDTFFVVHYDQDFTAYNH